MFSYDIKIRKFNGSSNLKAFASITIDQVMELDGFKVINGKNGLFVSVPSHKGSIMEEGVKVEKWFDDIRFPGEAAQEFGNELKAAILQAYNDDSGSSNPSQGKAVKAKAKANSTENESTSGPERNRKPLWGF